MHEDNTLSKGGFILCQAFWPVIAWLWYRQFLFKSLDGISSGDSVLILAGIVIACSFAGTLLQMKRRRNYVSVAGDIAVSYGIYTVIAYWSSKHTPILVILILASIISFIFAMRILCRNIRNKMNAKKICLRRFKRTAACIKNITALGLGVMMAFICLDSLWDNGILSPKTFAIAKEHAHHEVQTIDSNIETLALLDDQKWDKLSVNEQLSILQTVADIERDHLGITHELKVGTKKTNDLIGGYYNDADREIIVNTDYLNNEFSYKLVRTVAHEAFHAYSYRMVDALDQVDDDIKNLAAFEDAIQYKNELSHYISGLDDVDAYADQLCEVNARKYAQDRVLSYYDAVSYHIGQNDPKNSDSNYSIGDQITGFKYGSSISDEDDEIVMISKGELELYSYITTVSGHIGVIDKDSKIIILPVYKDIFADLEYLDIQEGAYMVSFILTDDNGNVNNFACCWPK